MFWTSRFLEFQKRLVKGDVATRRRRGFRNRWKYYSSLWIHWFKLIFKNIFYESYKCFEIIGETSRKIRNRLHNILKNEKINKLKKGVKNVYSNKLIKGTWIIGIHDVSFFWEFGRREGIWWRVDRNFTEQSMVIRQ